MNACNSSGLVKDFASGALDEIWAEARELGKGTDHVNSHPLMILFADKILQLAGSPDHNEVMTAYCEVKEASEEGGQAG